MGLIKKVLLLVALLVATTGCKETSQNTVTGGEKHDHFGYHGGWGLVQFGPSNEKKTVEVIDAESFAVGPGDKHYEIQTEPHPYDLRKDLDPRLPNVRDRVYLFDSEGDRIEHWPSGNWRLVFAVEGPEGRERREFHMQLRYKTYTPLQGPPN